MLIKISNKHNIGKFIGVSLFKNLEYLDKFIKFILIKYDKHLAKHKLKVN